MFHKCESRTKSGSAYNTPSVPIDIFFFSWCEIYYQQSFFSSQLPWSWIICFVEFLYSIKPLLDHRLYGFFERLPVCMCHIGPILDDRLKEKFLKPWKGVLCINFRVCLSVSATEHTFWSRNLIFESSDP